MITGKIILKSATKLTLNERFTDIAKQAPPTPRIQQQTNVTIPQSRRDLFANKKSATMSIANRLKKRSIRYRLGLSNNAAFNPQYTNAGPSRVFQRISFGNQRRGGRGGANSYLFGGQSGMGLRLRGQGRVGTRIFRSRTRGYLNNNAVSRYTGYSRRGNNNNKNNNRGRRYGNQLNRGRPNTGNKRFSRGRGNGRFQNRNKANNNNRNNNNSGSVTKETLDKDLDQYMAHTSLENDAIEMGTI